MKTTLDELLQRVNILDVVSQYVKLKKAGKDYAGLCPFHKEKMPSFTVSVEKQMFYCFSCKEGGNAVNFLMKYENMSFQEAQENLAKQYGVEIRKSDGGKRTSSFDALAKLADYYRRGLKNTPAAVQYLGKRGIGEDTIEEFKLGYSERTSGNLKGFLKNSGIPNDIYLSTGIVRMKDGELYDMFRGRIIVPIIDVNKRVIGFGGRTIDKDGFPKYVNSPESSVFSKRTALFGIDKTRKAISEMDEVFIVEGYFDFIALYMYGFKNIVATLGTAVTEGQISKLRNYTENITLMLDGDEAGVKSALRLIGLFAEMDVNGCMVVLPEGDDPDSFVRREGSEGLTKLTAKKKPILDYYFEYYSGQFDMKSLQGKLAFVKTVLPYVQTIGNRVKRGLYVKRLSELTGLDEEHFMPAHERSDRPDYSGTTPSTGKGPGGVIEKRVIGACAANPLLLEFCKGKEVMQYIKNGHVKEILSRMLTYVEEAGQFEVNGFVQKLDDEELRTFVLDSVFDSTFAVAEEAEKVLSDYFRHIEKQHYKEESRKISEKLSEAERNGDEAAIVELMEQKRQVLAYMKNNFL